MRPWSGLSRTLQPHARAPVSSAALSGRGRRRTEGAGFPARVSGPAALSCGRVAGAAGRSGRGRGRGPGVDPSRGEDGAPSQRAQGHGRDGAWRRGHVRRPCRPGLRVLAPARPESWPSVSRAAETAGPLGLPLPRRPEKAASGRKTPMSASAKGSRGTT